MKNHFNSAFAVLHKLFQAHLRNVENGNLADGNYFLSYCAMADGENTRCIYDSRYKDTGRDGIESFRLRLEEDDLGRRAIYISIRENRKLYTVKFELQPNDDLNITGIFGNANELVTILERHLNDVPELYNSFNQLKPVFLTSIGAAVYLLMSHFNRLEGHNKALYTLAQAGHARLGEQSSIAPAVYDNALFRMLCREIKHGAFAHIMSLCNEEGSLRPLEQIILPATNMYMASDPGFFGF